MDPTYFMHSSHCWVPGTKPYCRQAKIPRSASVSGVCSTVSGMPSRVLVSRSLVQQDKSNARPTTARFLFPRPKKAIKTRFPTATHTPQHAGDILQEQERSNSGNVIFRTACRTGSHPRYAVVRAGLTIAWPFLLVKPKGGGRGLGGFRSAD